MTKSLKRTALYDDHVNQSAKLIDFGGWEMPVHYTAGINQEHLACRTACGLFDVSHMGEIWVRGEDAPAFLDFALTQWISRMPLHQAIYTVMCVESGGIVDDLIVYRTEENAFLLVVNASNCDKDDRHLQEVASQFREKTGQLKFEIKNESDQWSQIAIQGPKSFDILKKATGKDFKNLKRFTIEPASLFGASEVWVARTGYTGEEGVEIYLKNESASKAWSAILSAGTSDGIQAIGLGARDTLRLEMKYPLYGNEISLQTHPLEAGLGWVVSFDKPSDFVGRKALEEKKKEKKTRKLVGFKLLQKAIPRKGYLILSKHSEQPIGEVTSGTLSPSLNEPIGIGYIAIDEAKIDNEVWISIRNRNFPAKVVKTPFVNPK